MIDKALDEVGTASRCREQAAHCLLLADSAKDERVRELLYIMGRMWSKLATETERRWLLRRDIVDKPQTVQARGNETDSVRDAGARA